ncbi:maturase, partial [Streptococcus pseudopneumoniae]
QTKRAEILRFWVLEIIRWLEKSSPSR